ncbi:MAG: hypothetical protein P8Y80_06290 [Acidobacteriota bacterium]|jgi:hypothetical protein
MTIKFWIGICIFLLIAAMGAFYQKCLAHPYCEYDGASIVAIYEVEIVLKDQSSRKFCSIFCAKHWFDNNKDIIDHVVVTDEIRGNKVESYLAYFVKSDLVTNETNGNCIHAFQQRQAAIAHADAFNGSPADDPFVLDE